MQEKIEQLLTVEENRKTSEADEAIVPLKEDAISKVLSLDKNGRVRGMGFKISPKMLEKEASEEQMNEPNKELAQQVAILTAHVKKSTDIVTWRDGATTEEVAI